MSEATELALRALRHRDRSRLDLDRRLARAGIPPGEREQALDSLVEGGLLSDTRFAEGRARVLVERSAGDELIRRELRHHGVGDDVLEAVMAGLPPEAERAQQALAKRGGGPKTVRYLIGKGFSRETLEQLIDNSLH